MWVFPLRKQGQIFPKFKEGVSLKRLRRKGKGRRHYFCFFSTIQNSCTYCQDEHIAWWAAYNLTYWCCWGRVYGGEQEARRWRGLKLPEKDLSISKNNECWGWFQSSSPLWINSNCFLKSEIKMRIQYKSRSKMLDFFYFKYWIFYYYKVSLGKLFVILQNLFSVLSKYPNFRM